MTKIDSRFICAMEQVLDLYEQPYNSKCPVICVDERPCQLIGNLVVPIPMKPSNPQKIDYHYKRNGTCSVFVAVEPLTGFRHIQVKKQRTKKEYFEFMESLAEKFPNVENITIIQDNLNTHNPSSFYENTTPEEAFRLMKKFDMCYTPKKGSWLNMAEIEISALSKQCLNRRIASMDEMLKEVNAWVKNRNAKKVKINWQFTKNDARNKLQNHYINIHK